MYNYFKITNKTLYIRLLVAISYAINICFVFFGFHEINRRCHYLLGMADGCAICSYGRYSRSVGRLG